MFSSQITKSSIINICISTSFQTAPRLVLARFFFGNLPTTEIGLLPQGQIARQILKYLKLVGGKIFLASGRDDY
jgi:hypothetical protein